MPDYRLEGLSSRSFEQLIQSLSQKHLGARTLVFGDGPDGAREVEFKGKFKLPPQNEEWNGRLIIQAKFLQVPHSRAKENTDWLINQFEKEMRKFGGRGSQSRKLKPAPDYYVLATNVRNSGVARTGGKDRVVAVLNKYKEKFGWKEWVLWDGSEISRMLDCEPDIRTSYSAWITVGDVFEQMLSKLAGARPNFERIMLSHLQQDFCSAQYAKLRQAGHGSEDKTPLSRLFVDLPITRDQAHEPPEERDKPDENNAKPAVRLVTFLEELFQQADLRQSPSATESMSFRYTISPQGTLEGLELDLDEVAPDFSLPSSWFPSTSVSSFEEVEHIVPRGFSSSRETISNRMVLLGGPGQGKTTLGQFACQLYRAALLSECSKPLLPETRDALNTLQRQCGAEIARPRARRYPIWIDLKELAKWIATFPDEPIPSLLMFIAYRLGSEVLVTDLQEWLRSYPWFIVFDGLDEVPASSGRARILKCIQVFVTDAHTLDADLVVLCTTRPQGYSREFDSRYYRHQWLAPLSPARALAYGEKLLDARHGKAGDDRRVFSERLKQAAGSPTTARVMRSPLQVTIMTALVERVGKPPEQRWKLFKEYYSVIYERERERGTAWSDALSKYDAEVDAIHRRIGWRLQVRSENASNSDARLTLAEFRAEVRAELSLEGHQGAELESLVGLLCNAATERLVFLVALGSEEVGFEIRSLQEFMAADHLFKEGDAAAARHLTRIAAVTYWRNVFLFGAGRVFAERRNLREHLLGVLDCLNEDSDQPAARLTLAGSILALDILEDGSANHIPASRDAMLRKACRLLDIALPAEHYRLGAVGIRANDLILREELERRLTGADREAWLGAFRCITDLWNDTAWGPELGRAHLPKSAIEIAKLLQTFPYWIYRQPYMRLFGTYIRENSPFMNSHVLFDPSDADVIGVSAELLAIARSHQVGRSRMLGLDTTELLSPFSIVVYPIFASASGALPAPVKEDLTGVHPDWTILQLNAEFMTNPSPEALAKALKRLYSIIQWPITEVLRSHLEWPILVALSECDSIEDVPHVAERAFRGEFGDAEKWKRFEDAMFSGQMGVDELVSLLSVDHDVGSENNIHKVANECGISCKAILFLLDSLMVMPSMLNDENGQYYQPIDRLLRHLEERAPKLAMRVVEAISWVDDTVDMSIDTFIKIASHASERRLGVSLAWLESKMIFLEAGRGVSEKCSSLRSAISEVRTNREYALSERTVDAILKLAKRITTNPFEIGLWRILSLFPPLPEEAVYSGILSLLPAVEDPQLAADSVALRIAGHAWTATTVTDFANDIIRTMPLRPDLPKQLVDSLNTAPAGDSSVELLPAALLERLPRDDWENRRIIRLGLRRLHSRRPSGMEENDDRKILQSVGL